MFAGPAGFGGYETTSSTDYDGYTAERVYTGDSAYSYVGSGAPTSITHSRGIQREVSNISENSIAPFHIAGLGSASRDVSAIELTDLRRRQLGTQSFAGTFGQG